MHPAPCLAPWGSCSSPGWAAFANPAAEPMQDQDAAPPAGVLMPTARPPSAPSVERRIGARSLPVASRARGTPSADVPSARRRFEPRLRGPRTAGPDSCDHRAPPLWLPATSGAGADPMTALAAEAFRKGGRLTYRPVRSILSRVSAGTRLPSWLPKTTTRIRLRIVPPKLSCGDDVSRGCDRSRWRGHPLQPMGERRRCGSRS